LLPRRWLGLGPFITVHRAAAGDQAIVPCGLISSARGPEVSGSHRSPSSSIVIPCRNEKGNIENAVLRMPRFGAAQEILFVEGNSSDGTFEECERVRDAYRDSWTSRS